MALSGTFQNYPVSSFGLYCEWSGVQSVTGNYTDVTLKVYLSYLRCLIPDRGRVQLQIFQPVLFRLPGDALHGQR